MYNLTRVTAHVSTRCWIIGQRRIGEADLWDRDRLSVVGLVQLEMGNDTTVVTRRQ